MSDSASYTQVTGKLDLISRQDAIEAFWKLDIELRPSAIDAITDMLKTLPSAEPEERTKERTETHACDLISRQAAIEAPVKMVSEGLDWIPVYHLKDLPSAESEQKCESCRYHNLEWDDEPCDSCTMGGEGCHYKPERKKGKWIDDGDLLTFKCDKCGYLVARYNNTNFCPNCGSYNGGEQE